MTREQFKYIVGIRDDEQVDILMLLGGDEAQDGDYTEVLKKWYEDLRQSWLNEVIKNINEKAST